MWQHDCVSTACFKNESAPCWTLQVVRINSEWTLMKVIWREMEASSACLDCQNDNDDLCGKIPHRFSGPCQPFVLVQQFITGWPCACSVGPPKIEQIFKKQYQLLITFLCACFPNPVLSLGVPKNTPHIYLKDDVASNFLWPILCQPIISPHEPAQWYMVRSCNSLHVSFSWISFILREQGRSISLFLAQWHMESFCSVIVVGILCHVGNASTQTTIFWVQQDQQASLWSDCARFFKS